MNYLMTIASVGLAVFLSVCHSVNETSTVFKKQGTAIYSGLELSLIIYVKITREFISTEERTKKFCDSFPQLTFTLKN